MYSDYIVRDYHKQVGYYTMFKYGINAVQGTETFSVPIKSIDYNTELKKVVEAPIYTGFNKVIFKGVCTRTDRPVALKAFTMKSCPDFLKSEFDNLYKLQHKNVLEFFGVSLTPGKFCMVTPLMDFSVQQFYELRKKMSPHAAKKELSELESREILSPFEIQIIALGSLEGLVYLHSEDIEHKHFKSPNVLINVDQTEDIRTARIISVRICDFGLSKLKLEMSSNNGGKGEATFRWRGPETFTREYAKVRNDKGPEAAAKKADIYSYGVFLRELRVCRQPFADLSEIEAIRLLSVGTREAIPSDYFYKGIIEKCWRFVPTERPKAGDLLEEIAKIEIPGPNQSSPVAKLAEKVSLTNMKDVEITKLGAEVARLNLANKDKDWKIERLNTKVQELVVHKENAESLQALVDIYNDTLVEKNNEIGLLSKQINALSQKNVEVEALQGQLDKIARLEIENAGLRKALAKSINDRSIELKAKNEELVQYKVEITQLTEENTELKAQNNELNELIKTVAESAKNSQSRLISSPAVSAEELD